MSPVQPDDPHPGSCSGRFRSFPWRWPRRDSHSVPRSSPGRARLRPKSSGSVATGCRGDEAGGPQPRRPSPRSARPVMSRGEPEGRCVGPTRYGRPTLVGTPRWRPCWCSGTERRGRAGLGVRLENALVRSAPRPIGKGYVRRHEGEVSELSKRPHRRCRLRARHDRCRRASPTDPSGRGPRCEGRLDRLASARRYDVAISRRRIAQMSNGRLRVPTAHRATTYAAIRTVSIIHKFLLREACHVR